MIEGLSCVFFFFLSFSVSRNEEASVYLEGKQHNLFLVKGRQQISTYS